MKWRKALLKVAKPFLSENKSDFLQFSLSLLPVGENHINENEFLKAIEELYNSLLCENCDFVLIKDKISHSLNRDSLLTNYITNRSMLHLLGKFNESSQINHPKLKECFSEIISLVLHFIEEFDDAAFAIQKIKNSDVVFNNDVSFDAHRTIRENFIHMKNFSKKVQFMNLYKGVPITNEAEIVSIDGDEICFKMDALQELAMKLDGKAYIVKNDYFNKHIKADIVYSNFANNTVVLDNFMYLLNMPAAQREYIRVHPNTIAKVTLKNKIAKPTVGNLYDLSYNGLGVVSEFNNGIKEGDEIDIEFELPIISQNITKSVHVKGRVLNIIEYHDAFRYCASIYSDKTVQDVIIDYVNEREEEILLSLKEQLREYMM